ncbi:MAG: hypothetical protein HKP38_04265 [Croceitalea sp.]|nr:hypothetical protein [Croceitalea sp.]MBT8238323.1 hypothetical protein [Croceitalea sp.]NNC34825.1 hypothetical protein [Croceitalea sp.]NNL08420.1 hypothetical protein [Croceitalea sp.]NNM18254.1 hypothetical protein [Croceitalea sp.]
MKKSNFLLPLFIGLLMTTFTFAQFGNGNRYGRQGRTAIPQAQTPEKEPEPKTAAEMVDEEMPKITESLELDPFEQAVVRSVLVKYVQKRVELQILKLEPKKMKEEYDKLSVLQKEELKAGLPEDKYLAYIDLEKSRFQKTGKKKKRKKKNKD